MTEWQTKYELLDETAKQAADTIISAVLDTMGNEGGALVLLNDATGGGKAEFYYGGNALLVEPLLAAGTRIAEQYLACDESRMQ